MVAKVRSHVDDGTGALAGDPVRDSGHLRPGSAECLCTVCGAYFATDTAFQKHRVGKIDARRCLTPAELVGKGLHLNTRGSWSRAAPLAISR